MKGVHYRNRCGGVGVECLIVVVLLGLLIAITIPRYHRAQTRAKTSAVRGDLRALGVALESYIADNSGFLFRTLRQPGETYAKLYGPLTTPIAYIPSLPLDPFSTTDPTRFSRILVVWGFDYTWGDLPSSPYPSVVPEASSAFFFSPFLRYSDGIHLLQKKFWATFSAGPDAQYAFLFPAYPSPMTPYDPSNGTMSGGDIVRLRGEGSQSQ